MDSFLTLIWIAFATLTLLDWCRDRHCHFHFDPLRAIASGAAAEGPLYRPGCLGIRFLLLRRSMIYRIKGTAFRFLGIRSLARTLYFCLAAYPYRKKHAENTEALKASRSDSKKSYSACRRYYPYRVLDIVFRSNSGNRR